MNEAPEGPWNVATGAAAIGNADAAEPVEIVRDKCRPGGAEEAGESSFPLPLRGSVVCAGNHGFRGSEEPLHPWLQSAAPSGPELPTPVRIVQVSFPQGPIKTLWRSQRSIPPPPGFAPFRLGSTWSPTTWRTRK